MNEPKKKTVLVVLNNFVHDTATGLWIACFLLGFEINRRWSSNFDLIPEIEKFLFTTSLIALLIIGLTGIIRRKTYTSYLYGVELETKRKTLLIIKHILFAVITLGGTYFLYKWAYLG